MAVQRTRRSSVPAANEMWETVRTARRHRLEEPFRPACRCDTFASGEGRGFGVVLDNAEVRWVHWLAAPEGEQKLRDAIVRNDGKSFEWDW